MRQNSSVGGFSEALWLAKKDVRRAWLSYPASGLFVFFFGLFIVPSINDLSGPGGAFDAFFADYFFLTIGSVLAVNFMSGDYFRVFQDDVFSHRVIFLRSLPVPVQSLVVSRVMSMLFALPFTVPAFYLPAFFLTDLWEMGFSYVWFVGIWLGWSLLYAGITLLCELGSSGRFYVWFSIAFIGVLIPALIFLEWSVSLRLVGRTVELAQGYGPLPAAASLVVGATAFILMARATVLRIERRDLS